MLEIPVIKVEGMANRCITDKCPMISFSLKSDRQGERLKEASIRVGDWEIKTVDQINNIYKGKMEPFTDYQVIVHAVGESGDEAEARTTFSTGRLSIPWKAKWITDAEYEYTEKESPVPMCFRREFTVKKQIEKAWINATAMGIYELSINGEKVGQDYFAPGFTSYDYQLQYQTYDIKALLKETNSLLAVVGGGWAAGAFNYNRKSKISADRQAFLGEIHIIYEDGKQEVIGTDHSWQVTTEGNYRAAEWYDGETYDATIEISKSKWKPADITSLRHNTKICAQYGCSVRKQEELKPVYISTTEEGEHIYDFGQNFAGVIAAKINGEKRQKIRFRHAEVLIDGKLFLKSLRTAKATATYICKEGEQFYSPRLTYMGFRFVGVSGIDKDKIDLSAYVLHSDLEKSGTFCCSNDDLNQLQSNIYWGGKSNFVYIPTDCPQRDERLGWTGDIAVFARTACFNFDMGRFLNKWLIDMRSEQGKGGGFPMVIPKAGDAWPSMANSCWGDSCILVPWAEYLARGDKKMLRDQYPAMKRFLKAAKWWSGFMTINPKKRYIWSMPYHWGDWCAPTGNAVDWIKRKKWVATAYFYNSCRIVSEIAGILDEVSDQKYYLNLAEKIQKSYRDVFTDQKGTLKNEFQTGYVLPLYFKMTDNASGETYKMTENLVKMIEEKDNHLDTGFPGTPYILFALSDNGRADKAYDLLLQDSCPSWLYAVKAGATTMWERWDALRPDGTVNITSLTGSSDDEKSDGGMVSFNHYANGAVGDWLYRRCLGIESQAGGYKVFRVKPVLGGGLSWVEGKVNTPYGKIAVKWKTEGSRFEISVEVPVSTTCHLVLPNGEEHNLISGSYCVN